MERRDLKVITRVAAAVMLAGGAVLSRVQVQYWRNSETLFRRALAVTRDNWVAHDGLGVVLEQSGRNLEAIGHLEQALRIKPDFAEAHCNLGIALGQAGRMPEAIKHLEQALRINPDFPEARYNLGIALEQAGRVPEAIEHYQQALKLRPDFAPARSALTRLGASQ